MFISMLRESEFVGEIVLIIPTEHTYSSYSFSGVGGVVESTPIFFGIQVTAAPASICSLSGSRHLG